MRLDIWYSGGPISIQQAYSLLLQTDHCTSSQYLVFAHLSRYGYRIKRRTDTLAKKSLMEIQIDPPPGKKLRIDPVDAQSLLPNLDISLNQSEHLVIFPPSSVEPWLLNLVPNFGGQGPVNLECDPILVPESCRNFRTHADFADKFKLLRQEAATARTGNQYRTKFQQKASNWIEFKKMPMQGVDRTSNSDNPLYRGSAKPLVMNENLKLGEQLQFIFSVIF